MTEPKPPRTCRYCHERPEVGRSQYCDQHGGRRFPYQWSKPVIKPGHRGLVDEEDDYAEESSP